MTDDGGAADSAMSGTTDGGSAADASVGTSSSSNGGSSSAGTGGAGMGGGGGATGATGGSDPDSGSDGASGGSGGGDAAAEGKAGAGGMAGGVDAEARDADGGSMACGFADTLDRRCTIQTDCWLGIHQTDCCGNTSAIGINNADRGRFDMLEPRCRASYPACGCASGPTRTDSGETTANPTAVRLACVAAGPQRTCRTYVTMRPPDTP